MKIPHSAKSSSQKNLDWRLSLNKNRQGVEYFTNLKNICSEVWMEYFRNSEFSLDSTRGLHGVTASSQIKKLDSTRVLRNTSLRNLGGKAHDAESDALTYLTNDILAGRKVDLLEINKEQLARNGHEMSDLFDKVDIPKKTSPSQLPALPSQLPASPSIFEDNDNILPTRSPDASATASMGFHDVLPEKSEAPPNTSENRQRLYRIALSRLHDGSHERYKNPESNIPLKDASYIVALSGIWNMFSTEANRMFSYHLEEGRRLCLRKVQYWKCPTGLL
ncbi:hypothetical protein FBU30_005217 [Linnemannia zychae]|nr:hypothetical protein FBU30_005217 [Linnemannia zychae]